MFRGAKQRFIMRVTLGYSINFYSTIIQHLTGQVILKTTKAPGYAEERGSRLGVSGGGGGEEVVVQVDEELWLPPF